MFLTKCGLKIGLTNFFKVGIHQKNIQNWFIDHLRANPFLKMVSTLSRIDKRKRLLRSLYKY